MIAAWLVTAFALLASVDWPHAVDKAAGDLNFHGVILVESHGHIILNKAFSNATSRLTNDTRYWIASISKSLTATLIFRLHEQGALSLQDPVAKFFPDAPPDKKGITVEQLLIHKSGLPNRYVSEGIVDRPQATKRILDLPLSHPPGLEFGYTNDGYSLLAAIAELAGGASYRQLLGRYVFQPAGMTNSGLWPVCPGSLPTLPLSKTLPRDRMRENWGYKGGVGVCSTTEDLAKFMTALIDGKILRPESLQQMWQGRVPIQEGFAASGWFLSKTPGGSKVVWTRGSDHGHNSIINYYPERELILASLSSSQNPDGPLLARVLVEKLERELHL